MMPMVLAADVDGQRASYRAEIKVLGEWPKVAAPATSPALEAALKANASARQPHRGGPAQDVHLGG